MICVFSIYLRIIYVLRFWYWYGNKSFILRNKIKYIGLERCNKLNRVIEFGIELRNWFYYGFIKRYLVKGLLCEKLGIGDWICYCCNEKKKFFIIKIIEV